jgi:hypothetical protein
LERMRKDQLLGRHEDGRAVLHEKLLQMRREREAREQQRRVQDEAAAALEAERLRQEEELLASEREGQRQKVDEFRQERERAEAARRAQLAAQREDEAARTRALVEAHRPNVQQRRDLLSEREEERRQKELELERKELQRMELLARLAEQVPYFAAIQSATSKLDHVTANILNSQYHREDFGRGFGPMNGYTDSATIADSRFRLTEALRSAGVIGSKYGGQVVQSLFPRPHLAVHGIVSHL